MTECDREGEHSSMADGYFTVDGETLCRRHYNQAKPSVNRPYTHPDRRDGAWRERKGMEQDAARERVLQHGR